MEFCIIPSRVSENRQLYATCVEGIRVENNTPGYIGAGIYAIANMTGRQAPRTNVARSGLEQNPHALETAKTLYSMHLEHIEDERKNLTERHSYSVSWAAYEISHLLSSLSNSRYDRDTAFTSDPVFLESLSSMPWIVLEEGGERVMKSTAEICGYKKIWTVEAASYNSIETLLREVRDSTSVSSIVKILGAKTLSLPDGPVVITSDMNTRLNELVFAEREVSSIIVDLTQRRLDIEWRMRESDSTSMFVEHDWPDITRIGQAAMRTFDEDRNPLYQETVLCSSDVDVSGDQNVFSVKGDLGLFLLPSPVRDFLYKGVSSLENGQNGDCFWFALRCVVSAILSRCESGSEAAAHILHNHFQSLDQFDLTPALDRENFIDAVKESSWNSFNTRFFVRDSYYY